MGIGIVIAGIVAYIAWQQYKIERDKLRFSFYDRRLKVFESLMDLFVAIGENGKCDDEIWRKYHTGKTEAPFLFDSEVTDYIKTVDGKAQDLLFACNTLKDLPTGEKRTTKVKEKTKLIRWFGAEHVHITSKFEKYFKFEQKLESKAMNWKRGFRRIAIILSIVGAIVGAIGGRYIGINVLVPDEAIYTVAEVYNDQKNKEQPSDEELTEIVGKWDSAISIIEQKDLWKVWTGEDLSDRPADWFEPNEKVSWTTISGERLPYTPEQIWEKTHKRMVNTLWSEYHGLYNIRRWSILAGSIIGFCSVWFLYGLVKWIAFGFVEGKPKSDQKQ